MTSCYNRYLKIDLGSQSSSVFCLPEEVLDRCVRGKGVAAYQIGARITIGFISYKGAERERTFCGFAPRRETEKKQEIVERQVRRKT